MELKITREKVLPSFSIDVAQLELLISKLTSEFNGDDLHISITIKRPSVELRFENVAELRSCSELPNKVTDLYLYIASGDRRMTMQYNYSGKTYIVDAMSNNEAWCAGIVEIVSTTAEANKKFYSAINKIPFLSIFCIILFILILMTEEQIQGIDAKSLSVPIALLLFVYFVKEKLFFPFTLIISSSENIIRRFAPELATLFGFVGCIAAIAGLFK